MTDTVRWSSSDPTVATVDAKGIATPLAVGKTTMRATAERTGNCAFSVYDNVNYEVR